MNRDMVRVASGSRVVRRAANALAAATVAMLVASPALADVAQTPLYLGGGNVPGNLVLVPSVEWPTINSVANLGEYDPGVTFVGYFDSNKCYVYEHSGEVTERVFRPVSWAVGHECAGEWSGNFMNWAATQTIDPFRKVLTGGYRARDTIDETWLEKARYDSNGGDGIFPNRSLHDAAIIAGATPFDANDFYMRVRHLGNEMRFRINDSNIDDDWRNYDPDAGVDEAHSYEVTVRVAVCVTEALLEPNCRAYPSGYYKPEGLIQQYADELRIGVFGFLNDYDMLRDGGVLRARQGFVGPTMIVPGDGETTNPNTEWDPGTGVFYDDPDSDDAAATTSETGVTIQNSGAVNYLNKFGQLTANDHKSHDPVSELYYTALRYLKDQGNVREYSDIPGSTDVDAAQATDHFPVITDWDDPIQYACQKNVILGIGDVNTHRDKNLPGSTSGTDEPAMPSAVANDDTVNVVTVTNEIAALEGISVDMADFSGRNNSAFIAGLAWDAHTRDLRPEMPGTQTVSTHWVDVLEAETLEPPDQNQYYLAAKYGGFQIPEEFDPDTHTGALPLEWWHTNGDVLQSFGVNANPEGVDFPRPDNYYLAGSASDMVESLTRAFARISAELRSSASSVAANSTRLDADTAVFQAAFDSTNWSGELQSFRINMDGTIADDPTWRATERLDALTEVQIGSRKIFTAAPPVITGDGPYVSTSGADFVWDELAAGQQDLLRQDPGGGALLDVTVGQDRLDWLRGSRAEEQPDGLLRERDSRLGDIVNSDPQFVHQQDFGYVLLAQSEAFGATTIGEAYKTFRETDAYLARLPMVVVGANDGMLHGFNASLGTSGGEELFAFVPNAAYEHLYELTLPEYSHRFYVDASSRVADAYMNGAWHTIVVGATGAGGRSVFALDVTDPGSMSAADDVLWEFTHPDMGYTLGQPAVAPLPNGEFGVVVTSGYETGAANGTIWILDPADGSVIKEISVPNSGDLGSPLVTDLNSDRVADRIYVGDTNGNLWRFDLEGSSTANWAPPSGLVSGGIPQPLFVAMDANGTPQAITAPLASAFNDNGLHTIFFGTGSFYRIDDNVVPDDPDVDSFYAIIDRGTPITSRTELLEQTIIVETTVNDIPVRAVSDHDMQSGQAGWYLDLVPPGGSAAGERVVSRATVRGDRVVFPTLIPNVDPCAFGGESWIMELSTFTGGRLEYAVFDLNDDAQFNDTDYVTVAGPNGDIRIPVSGTKPGDAIVKTPAIIDGVDLNPDDGNPELHEVKIVAGSDGGLVRIAERGSVGAGRQSWRQLR